MNRHGRYGRKDCNAALRIMIGNGTNRRVTINDRRGTDGRACTQLWTSIIYNQPPEYFSMHERILMLYSDCSKPRASNSWLISKQSHTIHSDSHQHFGNRLPAVLRVTLPFLSVSSTVWSSTKLRIRNDLLAWNPIASPLRCGQNIFLSWRPKIHKMENFIADIGLYEACGSKQVPGQRVDVFHTLRTVGKPVTIGMHKQRNWSNGISPKFHAVFEVQAANMVLNKESGISSLSI